MTRQDIIEMAREAGLHRQQHNLMSNPVQYRFSYDGYEENLERFAALVASAEREACAKVCDHVVDGKHPDEIHSYSQWAALSLAAEIRARSNT